ncbi:hypothetical protein [Pseudohaliea sp.]|uniref:hypothetical protein n=1 Tax=Pseudohaliea sp. TaxID=2740289 RepID=UPI0032EF598F
MRYLVPVLALALTCLATTRAEDFPGVRGLMSPDEYEASGLDKLSEAERKALDAWLLRYTARDAETLRSTSKDVREAEQEARIEARVRAPFDGWSGDTLFYLDNGQVWQQRLEGRFAYEGGERDVILDKNFFGFWRLTHAATGRKVGVKRIR